MDRTAVLEKIAPLLAFQVREADEKEARVLQMSTDDTEGHYQLAIRPGRGRPSVPLSEAGVGALVRHTGLGSVAEKLSPRTLMVASNELMGQKPFALLVKEGEVFDLVPPGRYHAVNAERALATIEQGVGDGVEFQRVLVLPHHTVSLETVGVDERPVTRGDLVRAGVLIQFSPVGVTNPLVQSYATRLFCTNGATGTAFLEEFHFGGEGGNGFFGWLSSSVRRAYGSFAALVEQWQRLVAEEIAPADRAVVLEALIRRAGISGVTAQSIRDRAVESPPANQWEAMNLLTWATSHLIQDGRQVARARSFLAGYAGDEHGRVCPTCARAR